MANRSACRWIDPEIAKGVAGEIMEAEAKRMGEESGLAWIRPIASSYAYNHAQDLYRVRLDPPEPTVEQAIIPCFRRINREFRRPSREFDRLDQGRQERLVEEQGWMTRNPLTCAGTGRIRPL